MELAIVRFLNHLRLPFIDAAAVIICRLDVMIVLFTVLTAVAVFLDRKQGKRVGLAVIVALVLHFVITEGGVKHLLTVVIPMRLRPHVAHPGVIAAIGYPYTDSSFPSSHMATSAAVLIALAITYRLAWPAVVLFLFAMAFARMHNGMHYPTDVAAGTALGTLYAIVAHRIAHRSARTATEPGAPALAPASTQEPPKERSG